MTLNEQQEERAVAEELSDIQNVDLREVWPNEATDFTPWLAENISKLSDALGLELELQSSEAPVGSYSLDLLAHDLGSDRPVIIENQLEATDHRHLGQLLTYASGYDAHVAVWIAKEFRDEHRQALDWLNQRSDENTEFFGVVIEVWKIDDSRPAPHFKLVATPNDWRKEKVTTKQEGATSERGEAYRVFFQDLRDRLAEEYKFTGATNEQTRRWCYFDSGFSGILYGSNFYIKEKKAKVELYLNGDRDRNEILFDKLREKQEAIESELQERLEWRRLHSHCLIAVTRPGAITDSSEALEEIQDWMIDKLLKFKQVFGPRLKELDTL